MQYPAATELALLSASPYSSRVFGDGGVSAGMPVLYLWVPILLVVLHTILCFGVSS